ncbi:MAG TPA: TlpA family protein disulfide reductase [Gammaproteobacteria bacterium]|nr:TlpA family protein disulfide reductase [Gammaproteobacteria bacterium]
MTKTFATIGQPAPQPQIECWVQGAEPSLKELSGQVILIEVIQVNCPGCFLHALPEVIHFHETYASQGLKVFIIATAFEHFEHNTLNNLQRLLQQDELQGDPLSQLGKAGYLDNNRLPYSIPFSVAMDKLVKNETEVTRGNIDQFILGQVPDFYQNEWPEERKKNIIQQAEDYLRTKAFHALTFEMYQLQGTPSSILIDKKGILRRVSFGAVNTLETDIQQLLQE